MQLAGILFSLGYDFPMEGSRCLSWLFLREEGWNRGSLFALAPDTVQPVSGAFFYLFFLFIRVETGCTPPASGESPLTAHPPLRCGRDSLFTALKGGKQLHAAGDCGRAGSARRGGCKGGKLPPLQSKRMETGCRMRNKIPLSAL